MQVSDLLHASPLAANGGREVLRRRIEALAVSRSKMAGARKVDGAGSGASAAEIDADDRKRLDAVLNDESLKPEELRDGLSTALMDAFRKSTGRATFGLLYELNAAHLLIQVAGRLRRYGSKADAGDVLQEVFFNVYRYPHRFDSGREDAFRVWTAMIVRNTVLKHLRSRSTGGGNRREIPFEDLSDQPVAHAETPLADALQNEANLECGRAYITYLQLYIEFYSMLSERERRALYLVEVDGVSYREAANDLGIKLENLKMVIFRARKKIHRAMRRVFDGLSPDCKPARVGRVSSDDGESDASPSINRTS
ncbi:MAG: RNA polymerase sigma factor [Planctomycetota bacterium]